MFQEYVPSGRQQALRHPGPLELHSVKSLGETDDFLLNRFKKVSLLDGKQNEWWILHKVESATIPLVQERQDFVKCEVFDKNCNRNIYKTHNSEVFDDSSGFRTGVETSFNKFGKRLSDASSSKTPNKRLSLDTEERNITKQCLDLCKS